MPYTETNYLSYKELRKRQSTSALQQAELPTEHAISLPLPTRRWLRPGYASFASPALRKPGQPLQQGTPDRWWVIDAHNGRLIIYTLWELFPFAQNVSWTRVELPRVTHSIAELQSMTDTIELLLDALASAFFAGEFGNASTRNALQEALYAYIPAPLLPQYHALTSDFFTWLES